MANLCTKYELCTFNRLIDLVGSTKIIKVGHMTQAMPLLTYFCIFRFVGLEINACTKCKVSNFTHSRDIEGSQNVKVGHVT